MNIEHPSPEALQRYFDGELTAEEREQLSALQAHIAACATCTTQLATLARLHDFVRMAATDSAQQADFERMFANIERGIEAGTPSIEVKPARAAGSSGAAPVTNLLHPKLRRLSNAVPALGAVALAAAALLMVYHGDAPQNGAADEPYEVSGGHSEIVEVDFGSNAGTVFDISLSDGSSSAVVWIDDDDDDEEQVDDENANQE